MWNGSYVCVSRARVCAVKRVAVGWCGMRWCHVGRRCGEWIIVGVRGRMDGVACFTACVCVACGMAHGGCGTYGTWLLPSVSLPRTPLQFRCLNLRCTGPASGERAAESPSAEAPSAGLQAVTEPASGTEYRGAWLEGGCMVWAARLVPARPTWCCCCCRAVLPMRHVYHA
jgi:hypothetical protein